MFNSIQNDVYALIKRWQPATAYPNENGYRDDLLKFLRAELNKPSMMGNTNEFSIKKEDGRALADIAIGREVGIELKKDLRKLRAIDILVGQIDRYKKDYNGMIVVLVGTTGDEALEELKGRLRSIDSGSMSMNRYTIDLIVKGDAPEKPKQSTGGGFGFGGGDMPSFEVPKFDLGF